VETDRWGAAAALVDRSRRALYEYVRRQGQPVSREEAARAQRISRGLAAFHLDKLVEAGLLTARYQPPAGRPRGRGRAPKVYESAAPDGLMITIPERRYRLVAEILADAVADTPADAAGAARRLAFRRGQELGTRLRAGDPAVTPPAVLAELGFEPQPAGAGRLVLDNCPFHALAQRQTALVCGINHAYLSGLVAGLATGGLRAELVPRPGACCVELAPDPT